MFYHSQGLEDAIAGKGPSLAFGALDERLSGLELGDELVSVLGANGLELRWPRDAAVRISLAPFRGRAPEPVELRINSCTPLPGVLVATMPKLRSLDVVCPPDSISSASVRHLVLQVREPPRELERVRARFPALDELVVADPSGKPLSACSFGGSLAPPSMARVPTAAS